MYNTYYTETDYDSKSDFYSNNARANKFRTYKILLHRYEDDTMLKYRRAQKNIAYQQTAEYKRLCEIKQNLERVLAQLREQLNIKQQ